MTMEEMLQKYGLKYDDLTAEERETLNVWMNALRENSLSIEKIRDFIANMLFGVQMEISRHELGDKQDLFLKARLRHLTMLQAFLTSPEKAKDFLEKAIQNIAGSVG